MSQINNNIESETITNLGVDKGSIYSEGGSLFFTATVLTEKFVPLEVMEKYAWTGKGKEVRFRHKIPEQNVDALIGHVHECYYENEKIRVKAEVWGYKNNLKEIQQKIIDDEYSISLGFKKSTKDTKVVGMYIRELSITPSPQCTSELGCGIESIIVTNEKKIDNKNKKDDNMAEEKGVKDLIQTLENTLISQVKEKSERIVELESTISVMEDRIQASNQIVTEQTDKIEKLEKENKELKASFERVKIEPLIDKLIGLEKLADEKAIKEEREKLSSYSASQLNDSIERFERIVKVNEKIANSKSAEKPVLGSVVDENKQLEDISKLTPEQVVEKVNPNLRKYMQNNMVKKVPVPTGFGVKSGSSDVPFIE